MQYRDRLSRALRLIQCVICITTLAGCSFISAVTEEGEPSCASRSFAAWVDTAAAATLAASALPVAAVKGIKFGEPNDDEAFRFTLLTMMSVAAVETGAALYGFRARAECEVNRRMRRHVRLVTRARERAASESITKSAVERLQSECSRGAQKACADLGMRLFLGSGVPQDISRSNSLFAAACEAGVASACYNLASSYEEGSGVEQDLEQAQRLYQSACLAGDLDACDIKLSEPSAP